MKVLKVIVDEIPDSCNACDYEGNVECFRRMAFEEYLNYDTTRPDWCPLVKYCEICEGFGAVMHASKGLIPCPACKNKRK